MKIQLNSKIDLLKEEYAILYGMIDSFDSKTLTMKTWSVTVSMSGIGIAFLSHAPVLLLLSSLSSLLFWFIEAKWKVFQDNHFTRIFEIESFFGDIGSDILPMQIGTSWDDAASRSPLKRLVKHAFFSNVMLPHILVFLFGVVLFLLSWLNLIVV